MEKLRENKGTSKAMRLYKLPRVAPCEHSLQNYPRPALRGVEKLTDDQSQTQTGLLKSP
jgi:hypothetical protein